MSRTSSVASAENNPQPSAFRSALIRRFDFSSQLQRASVICKNDFDASYKAFVKGSPEKIFELCRRETIPVDF
jgi:cation-transporting P-type ATPase 13A2